MVKPVGFQTVALKKPLVDRIKKVIKAGIGYRSINEFVAEAVRLRLEEVEKHLLVREVSG